MALVLSLLVALPLLGVDGAIVILSAVVMGLVMVGIAHRHFGGVTGDVFGSTNELTRAVCAVVLVAVISW